MQKNKISNKRAGCIPALAVSLAFGYLASCASTRTLIKNVDDYNINIPVREVLLLEREHDPRYRSLWPVCEAYREVVGYEYWMPLYARPDSAAHRIIDPQVKLLINKNDIEYEIPAKEVYVLVPDMERRQIYRKTPPFAVPQSWKRVPLIVVFDRVQSVGEDKHQLSPIIFRARAVASPHIVFGSASVIVGALFTKEF